MNTQLNIEIIRPILVSRPNQIIVTDVTDFINSVGLGLVGLGWVELSCVGLS